MSHQDILNDNNLSDRTLLVVKRHPIGVVAQALAFIVTIAVAGGFLLQALPFANDSGVPTIVVAVLYVLVGFVALAILAGMVYLYTMSELRVAEQNITQVIQKGFFNKKVSKLSMSSVEDVSYYQKGILPTAFNYGTLVVETAGEQQNFVFKYAVESKIAAEVILAAHERYLHLCIAEGRNQVLVNALG